MAQKVLIIDDEENIVLGLTALLEHQGGIEVASNLDPEEGLAKVKEWLPDVVLMDIYMPKIDGWEATRRIKADPETKRISVVVMTAVLSRELQDRMRECGADRVITKPCVDRDIAQLMQWLGKQLH